MPEGACNCEGEQLDAVGVCGGTCASDSNQNGICDDLEQSLCGNGTIWSDALGVCICATNNCPTDLNGDGATTTTDLLDFLTAFGDLCPE